MRLDWIVLDPPFGLNKAAWDKPLSEKDFTDNLISINAINTAPTEQIAFIWLHPRQNTLVFNATRDAGYAEERTNQWTVINTFKTGEARNRDYDLVTDNVRFNIHFLSALFSGYYR